MSEVQGEVLFKSSRPTYQDIDALRVFVRAGVVVGVRLQNATQRHGLVVARDVALVAVTALPLAISLTGGAVMDTSETLRIIDETEPVIVAGWN